MSEYTEIQIPFHKENYDAICNKIYLKDAGLTIEEDIGCLKLYSDDENLDVIKNIIAELEHENIIQFNSAIFTQYENRNWNSEWEKTIEPVTVADKIVIFPSWKRNELGNVDDKILIEIDPKMSFGTGHNETTQLVLEMMCEHLDDRDVTMLDVGTGTGILSIAAIRLGVKSALAFDIDKDSIENAEEYVKLNHVEDRIVLKCTTIKNIQQKEFDIVAANIIRSVIIDNLDEILLRLKEGGKLFLSGVLQEEEDIIRKALEEKDIEVVEVRNRSEWLGIYAVKK